MTKDFQYVFQDCQRLRNFISSLIEVNEEIDVKSSSQFLTVENVKVMFIICC